MSDQGTFMERMEKAIELTLERRSDSEGLHEELKHAGCIYRTFVGTGKASENLEILAKNFKPDIIVLGRSASVGPFTPGLGRMAMNCVLSDSRAVLVVPPV